MRFRIFLGVPSSGVTSPGFCDVSYCAGSNFVTILIQVMNMIHSNLYAQVLYRQIGANVKWPSLEVYLSQGLKKSDRGDFA